PARSCRPSSTASHTRDTISVLRPPPVNSAWGKLRSSMERTVSVDVFASALREAPDQYQFQEAGGLREEGYARELPDAGTRDPQRFSVRPAPGGDIRRMRRCDRYLDWPSMLFRRASTT